VAVVLMIALLSARDQEVIREPGAHNWANYPVGADRGYWDYAGAASVIARTGGGEGIVLPTGDQSWRMIDEGVPPGEVAHLRARYHVVLTRHVEGLSIFLLERDAPSRSPGTPGRLEIGEICLRLSS
jgi:hypothetical protein